MSSGHTNREKPDKDEVIQLHKNSFFKLKSISNLLNLFNKKFKHIPIGVKWEWDDNKKCLFYKKYDLELLKVSNTFKLV